MLTYFPSSPKVSTQSYRERLLQLIVGILGWKLPVILPEVCAQSGYLAS
jgi:hypothetical protein